MTKSAILPSLLIQTLLFVTILIKPFMWLEGLFLPYLLVKTLLLITILWYTDFERCIKPKSFPTNQSYLRFCVCYKSFLKWTSPVIMRDLTQQIIEMILFLLVMGRWGPSFHIMDLENYFLDNKRIATLFEDLF